MQMQMENLKQVANRTLKGTIKRIKAIFIQ